MEESFLERIQERGYTDLDSLAMAFPVGPLFEATFAASHMNLEQIIHQFGLVSLKALETRFLPLASRFLM